MVDIIKHTIFVLTRQSFFKVSVLLTIELTALICFETKTIRKFERFLSKINFCTDDFFVNSMSQRFTLSHMSLDSNALLMLQLIVLYCFRTENHQKF